MHLNYGVRIRNISPAVYTLRAGLAACVQSKVSRSNTRTDISPRRYSRFKVRNSRSSPPHNHHSITRTSTNHTNYPQITILPCPCLSYTSPLPVISKPPNAPKARNLTTTKDNKRLTPHHPNIPNPSHRREAFVPDRPEPTHSPSPFMELCECGCWS